jgi:hypothetical protein
MGKTYGTVQLLLLQGFYYTRPGAQTQVLVTKISTVQICGRKKKLKTIFSKNAFFKSLQKTSSSTRRYTATEKNIQLF